MRLTDLLGTRFVSGDDWLPVYEGPVAGAKSTMDLTAVVTAISRVEREIGGCGRGRLRVGVLSNFQVETYVSVMASVTGDHTFVPLNPKFPISRLKQIVSLGNVDVIAVDAGTVALCAELSCGLPVINVSEVIGRPASSGEANATSAWRESLVERVLDEAEIAYVMFTSGSTGTPKGVPISYENLRSYVHGITRAVDLDRGLRFTQFFDLSFDLSIHDIFVSNFAWGTLIAPSAIDLMLPSGYVAKNRINVWFSVPILGAQLSRAQRKQDFAGIDHMLFCGEALPMETVIACRTWLSEKGNVWNLYGPTEATIAFTGACVTESERSFGNASIGLPFGQNEIALLVDGTVQRELVDDVEGELLLGGPQVFAGYSTNAASPFLDADGGRWYRSGDLVHIDHEGVYFRGRLDSQVKYRGYRIELGEIEVAIRHTYNLNTVAVVLSGTSPEPEIVAFYLAGESNGAIEPSALQESIPSYMIPGSFVALERMPTNPNNKIDRSALVAWQG
jgi:non-ribosomal peptide synthetase component F